MALQSIIFIIILSFVNAVHIFDYRRDVQFDFFNSQHTDDKHKSVAKGYFDGNNNYHITIPKMFDHTKQTFLYIHGYLSPSSYQDLHVTQFFENACPVGTDCHYNFIVVNWTKGCFNTYASMFERSRGVSENEKCFNTLCCVANCF